MAKTDYTVKIEDGRIMFMTSYWDEFGEEKTVANIISKKRLIEIHKNISDALSELNQADVVANNNSNIVVNKKCVACGVDKLFSDDNHCNCCGAKQL